MSITIVPTIADITIGSTTWSHADWEANTPGTISGIANAIGTSVLALGTTTGSLVKAISGNVHLTTDEAANLVFLFVGALSGVATVYFPAGVRMAVVANNTTGGHNIQVGYNSGRVVSLPMGASATVYGDDINYSLADGTFRTPSLGAHVVDTLEVDDVTTFHSYVIVDGYLSIAGDLDSESNLNVGGNGVLAGTLNVASDTEIGGALSVVGNVTVTATNTYLQDLGVSGDLNVTGDINTTGTIVGNSLAARHAALNTYVYIDSPEGGLSYVEFASAGVTNWRLSKSWDSSFQLDWFTSAGVYMATPIKIDQVNGYVRLLNLPTTDTGVSGTLWSNDGVLTVS